MTSQPSRGEANAALGPAVDSSLVDLERPPTVLVVGDSPGFTDLYPGWLAKYYEVETATSGLELLATLGTLDGAVDIVLLPPRLHGLTASECLERIRTRGYACRVALVGSDVPADPVDAGFDAALERPVSTADLRDHLETLWRYRQYDLLVRERCRLELSRETTDVAGRDAGRTEAVRSELERLAATFDSEDFRALFLTVDCDRRAETPDRSTTTERRVA